MLVLLWCFLFCFSYVKVIVLERRDFFLMQNVMYSCMLEFLCQECSLQFSSAIWLFSHSMYMYSLNFLSFYCLFSLNLDFCKVKMLIEELSCFVFIHWYIFIHFYTVLCTLNLTIRLGLAFRSRNCYMLNRLFGMSSCNYEFPWFSHIWWSDFI
jgi:hypothetical protein